jgi:DNA-nicking Smr family endonuclease
MTKLKSKKLNKYERPIEAEVDLHGLRLKEAQLVFVDFLAEVLESGYNRVRIVTGKGLHSVAGVSVIKEMVTDILKAQQIKFREGKPAEGGSGAIVVDF